MSKDSLKGTGKVFSFTLRQMLRSKSNIVTLVIFALIAVAAVPVASLILGSEKPAEASMISQVHINNESEYELDLSDMGEYFANVEFLDTTKGFDLSSAGLFNLYVGVGRGEADGALTISIVRPDETNVTDADIEMLRSALYDRLEQARFKALGASPEQLDIFMSGFSVGVMKADEYESNDAGFTATYVIQYAYAVILLVVSMFTIIFIIRAVVEEKASKLVELLMVNVRPLALLAGKILAAMTYIFGMLLGFVALFALSYSVTGVFLDTSAIAELLSGLGLSADVLNISPAAFISVLVSLILSYLFFSIFSGLMGTTCSTMEDIESANTTVMFTILGGYMISIFVSMFGGPIAVVGSLVPVVSAFVAPAQYILGGISFWLLLASWVIQIVVIVLLALFSARVYKSLIMYSGNRVKLRMLLNMYKEQARTVHVSSHSVNSRS